MDQVNSDVELSPIEQKALEQGWKPKDQFEGNEEDFVTAAEFIRRGELFGKIKDIKNEMFSQRQAHSEELRAMHSEMMKMRKSALEQARNELKAQLNATDDKEEAVRLTTEVHKVETEIAGVKEPQPQVPQHPAIGAWMNANKGWYNVDPDMTMEADTAAAIYLRTHPGASPEVIFEVIDKKMRRSFPEKFEGEKKVSTPPPPAAPDKKVVSKATKYSVADLPDNAKSVMKTLVKRGVTTEEKYLKDYFGE